MSESALLRSPARQTFAFLRAARAVFHINVDQRKRRRRRHERIIVSFMHIIIIIIIINTVRAV
jgi:hypothetical protein